MDSDIEKEASKINQQKRNSLYEYKPQYPVFTSIIDERDSDPYSDVKKRIQQIRENSESRSTEHPYPWEDADFTENGNPLRTSREPNKDYVKKIYVVGGNLSDSQTEETVQVVRGSETKPINPQLNIRGEYGTFISSKKSKNAPLIFILGGLTWPKTDATDSEIGNGPNQSKYPGDKKQGVEGYMWTYGFKNLVDFNIYNCFTHKTGKEGWSECTKILTHNGISPEKNILVLFSAGVNMAHEGLLNVAPINYWDIAHLIGPTSGALKRSSQFTTLLNNSTYYIQSRGLEISSEGADSEDKKKFANALNSKDQVLTSKDHTNGIKISSEWIKKNVKVSPPLEANETEKRIVIRSNGFTRPGAKFKGGKTILYSYNSRGYASPVSELPLSPIADRAKAASEIAKIKRDPGYINWRKNIETLCRGDEFLFRLYDLCVDLKCSFRDMMFVIAAECGFNPTKRNTSSNAQGLIQFVPQKNTLNYSKHGFGSKTPGDFSAIQQLPYVKRYYENRSNYNAYKEKFGTGIPNLIAAYTFVTGGNTTEPFSNGRKQNKPIYAQDRLRGNPQWDYNGDGVAYAWEITDYAIRHWYFSGKSSDKRGVRLPPGNSWSADGETIGMKIWDLKNNRPRR